MDYKKQIENELEAIQSQVRSILFLLEKTHTSPQTLREVESEWSDVLTLLHPHQKDGESLYETAKRVIPNS